MYSRFCRGRHLSLRSCDPRPVLACRVLPGLAVPAATRPNRFRSPAHSPCSRLHARPADDIAAAAGGLLPHRFSPDGAAVASDLRRECFLLRL